MKEQKKSVPQIIIDILKYNYPLYNYSYEEKISETRYPDILVTNPENKKMVMLTKNDYIFGMGKEIIKNKFLSLMDF